MGKDLHAPAYIKTARSNVVRNSSKLEITQISIYNRTDEETVVDHTNGPLYMNENEQTSPTGNNMNKPQYCGEEARIKRSMFWIVQFI